MKKLYVLFALMIVSSIAFSQTIGDAVILSKKQVPAEMMTKTPTDTCGWSMNFIPEFAISGSVVNYSITGGGYIFGTNGYYNEVAQGYVYSGFLGIEGTLIWFAMKNESGSNPNMTVTAYGGSAGTPGGTIGSTTLSMSSADTVWPNWSWAPFASVLPSNGDFFVGVNFSALVAAGDSINILADTKGDASGLNYAVALYSGSWTPVDDMFTNGMDVDIAIFPVVDINYVGINDDNYFYGMQSNAYPIPASSNMTIEYALENDADVKIEIIAANGATIDVINEGNMTAGAHSASYNVSDLQSGQYFYSIHANGHRLIKSFVVE